MSQKKSDRALSTGSSSHWRRRHVFPTPVGHASQGLCTSSTSMLQVSKICCGTLAHLWVLRACSRHGITRVISWGCHPDYKVMPQGVWYTTYPVDNRVVVWGLYIFFHASGRLWGGGTTYRVVYTVVYGRCVVAGISFRQKTDIDTPKSFSNPQSPFDTPAAPLFNT